MRLSLATAACVVSIALLAGCSNSPQGSSALPGSGSGVSSMAPGHFSPQSMYAPRGGINPHDLLRLQAEGRIPAPGGRTAAEKAYRQIQHGVRFRPPAALRPGSAVTAIWANLTYYQDIVGFNKKGKKVTAAISVDTSPNYCDEPFGLKVDHSQNVWVGCYEGYNGSSSYQIQAAEYSSGGSEMAAYTWACPNGWGSCDYGYFYSYNGYDVAVNSSNVFVDGFFYGYKNTSQFYEQYGIEYWPNGSPSATPNIILPPESFSSTDVQNLYGMDLDSAGNLWVAFYGYCASNSTYGYGLAEITNPTSSPTWSNVEPCGTYNFGNAVYTSNGGNMLNVLDSSSRKIYQYTLPLSTGGSPSNVLGPTAPLGEPEGLGFNSTDTNVVSGDDFDWLNIGTVATNKWKQEKPVILISNLYGSGYTPSDK